MSRDDPEAEGSLKRLGGGRWQTRDERFTIEPQSGTWAIVDAEQTDELGLPLVRGPFPSLTAAKAAIGAARGGEPAASPLPERATALRTRPSAPEAADAPSTGRRTRAKPKPSEAAAPVPSWLDGLSTEDRRRATRAIRALTAAGARDPEGLARRDVAGDVPAIATHAVLEAVRSLGSDATPGDVAAAVASGQDRALGVRWRLVDGEGRPITITAEDVDRR